MQWHTYVDAVDSEVLQTALQLDAILLTVDMDFSNILDYPPPDYRGIIVMRDQGGRDETASNTLKLVLAEMYPEKLRGRLVVINKDRYKIR